MVKSKSKKCTVEDVNRAIDKAIKVLKVEEYEVDVKIFDEFLTGSLATYDVSKNLISLNTLNFIDDYEGYGLSIDTLVTAVLAHELGHYLHLRTPCGVNLHRRKAIATRLSPIRARRITIEAEKKAWEYGGHIIPRKLRNEFDYLNKTNLANCSYWKSSNDWRKSVKKLKEKYGIGK